MGGRTRLFICACNAASVEDIEHPVKRLVLAVLNVAIKLSLASACLYLHECVFSGGREFEIQVKKLPRAACRCSPSPAAGAADQFDQYFQVVWPKTSNQWDDSHQNPGTVLLYLTNFIADFGIDSLDYLVGNVHRT